MEVFFDIFAYLKFGGVSIVSLLIVSFLMWILIIERFLFFREIEKKDISTYEAMKIMKESSYFERRGILSKTLGLFLEKRVGNSAIDKKIIEECIMEIKPNINKFLKEIEIFAAVAPLLGLLGTIIGMVATFDAISLSGVCNVKGISNGISKALITTQSGLIVAIPGLFMSVYLSKKRERAERILDEFLVTLKRVV